MRSQIVFTVTLRRPALFSTVVENPNLVSTQGYLPGSALLGAMAGNYLRLNSFLEAHLDADFRRFFLHGDLLFLNAYPLETPINYADAVRLLPTPRSLLKNKANELDWFDLSHPDRLKQSQDDHTNLRSIGGFIHFDDTTPMLGAPRKQMRHHLWRPNRLTGRAAENDGAIFLYESLEAGQRFQGRIVGSKNTLEAFLKKMAWESGTLALMLGRSGSAEYGGKAEVTHSGIVPFTREIEEADRDEETLNEALFTDTTGQMLLAVTLLSPLIGRDSKTGHPQAEFPVQELETLLKPAGVTGVKLQRAYTAEIVIGGFVAKWGLPRPQSPALDGGSVFLFKVEGQVRPDFLSTEAEQHSLGARTPEGFGRFALNWHTLKNVPRKPQSSGRAASEPSTPFPKALREIYAKTHFRARLDHARSLGIKDGSSVQKLDRLSSSQISRLRNILAQPTGLEELQGLLTNLRDTAKNQLDAARIEMTFTGRSQFEPLFDFLYIPPPKSPAASSDTAESEAGTVPRQVIKDLWLSHLNASRSRQPDTLPLPPLWNLPDLSELQQQEIVRTYLLSLCTEMARSKREPSQAREQGGDAT